MALADGGLGEGAGDVGLAEAGGADDQHALVSGDPARLGELEDERAVKPAGGVEVDVLDAGLVTEAGRLEVAEEAAVLALLQLDIDQHAEAVVEGQRLVVGSLHLLLVGAAHAHEVEIVELVEGR